VLAVVGLVRARAVTAASPGARISLRLWLGLALGVLAVVLVVVALSRT
jgi:hypothetical protein